MALYANRVEVQEYEHDGVLRFYQDDAGPGESHVVSVRLPLGALDRLYELLDNAEAIDTACPDTFPEEWGTDA